MSRILVIGDSYAEGKEGDTGKKLGWPDIMGIPMELRQGIGGSMASEWYANKGDRLHRAINTPSDVLIVSLLGNDAQNSDATPVQIIVGIEELNSIVGRLSNSDGMFPKKTFVFLYPDPFLGKSTKTRLMIPLLNRAIRIACWGLKVDFIDLSVILTDPKCFTGKDIHPTRYGHQLIANYLQNVKKISV